MAAYRAPRTRIGRRLAFIGVIVVGSLVAAALPQLASASGKRVSFAGVSVSVPASWRVDNLNQSGDCVLHSGNAVFLGHQAEDAQCPASSLGTDVTVQIEPLDQSVDAQNQLATDDETINGVAVRLDPNGDTSHTLVAAVDSRNALVSITFGDDEAPADAILNSLQLSDSQLTSYRPAAALMVPEYVVPQPGAPYQGLAFDACSAPSLTTMHAWLRSPFRAVGVYIGGANRGCSQGNLTARWVHTVEGWGFRLVPIYVGLQAPCVYQRGLAHIKSGIARAQGEAAANDAANRALALGLGEETVLVNDMEAYGNCAAPVMDFLGGWSAQLHKRNFKSGVYTGIPGIHDIERHNITKPDMIFFAVWDGRATTANSAISSKLWANHQRIHQFRGGHNASYGGRSLNIDSSYANFIPLGKRPGTVAPGVYPGYPIRPGSAGVYVKEIQKKLGLKATGNFGAGTETAVKTFQKKHGLTVDGIVGKATWDKLFAKKAPTPAPKPKFPGELHYGMHNKYVAMVQRALHIKADGIFGSATKAAVQAFQRRHHLPSYGVVGPGTWAALF